MQNQFEVVTSFYPAQRLTIFADQSAIMKIMNCEAEEAVALLSKIDKKVGNEFGPHLRTSVFCDHMGIDEMLVQVFLASLDSFAEPLPPNKRLPALTREEIVAERPNIIDNIRRFNKGAFNIFHFFTHLAGIGILFTDSLPTLLRDSAKTQLTLLRKLFASSSQICEEALEDSKRSLKEVAKKPTAFHEHQ